MADESAPNQEQFTFQQLLVFVRQDIAHLRDEMRSNMIDFKTDLGTVHGLIIQHQERDEHITTSIDARLRSLEDDRLVNKSLTNLQDQVHKAEISSRQWLLGAMLGVGTLSVSAVAVIIKVIFHI